MAKCELKNLYKKIVENGIHTESHSFNFDFEQLIKRFEETTDQDRPDGIIPIGNTVFVLEHFQISIYINNERDDLYQKAMGEKTRYFKKYPDEKSAIDELMPGIQNLLKSFQSSLISHLRSYPAYMEKAQERYPNQNYVFVLVVEDNSQDIFIDEENPAKTLSILGVYEFVNSILNYPEIDGVILYSTSQRGDFLVAEDTEYLTQQKNEKRLIPISRTHLLSCLSEIESWNPALLKTEEKNNY